MGAKELFGTITGFKKISETPSQTNANGDFSVPANYQEQPNQNMYPQQQMTNIPPQYQNQPNYNNVPVPQAPVNNLYPPQQPVAGSQSVYDYQRQLINDKNTGYNVSQYNEVPVNGQNMAPQPNQQMYVPRNRVAHNRRHQIPTEFDNGMYQQNIDYNAPRPVEYGNFQEQQVLDRMNLDYNAYEEVRRDQYRGVPVQQVVPQMAQPQYRDNYNEQNMYREPIRQPQYEDQINYGSYMRNDYNNPTMSQANYYQPSTYNYSEPRKTINILPTQIAKEVRSEKMRVAILMLLGIVGVVLTSILIAGYYTLVGIHDETARNAASFAGFKLNAIPYPLVSIFFLIVALFCFFLGVTDYSLLYANVKKYERDLMAGKETIPYFITRNYKNIISRGVYITWVCFATYIIGAISLGILYGLQGLYEGGNDKFYFLFWKMGQLKSFKSEITINIVVLILTLGTHITNIVWSRSRKNNVIGYYGSSILPSEEERAIKKRANKICLIILCVVLAIVLFAIVIPWIILRRRRGQSVMPFGRRN
jgi:hypothetical protein